MRMHPSPTDITLPVTYVAATSDGDFVKLYANGHLIGQAPSSGGTVEWYVPTPFAGGLVVTDEVVVVIETTPVPVVGSFTRSSRIG